MKVIFSFLILICVTPLFSQTKKQLQSSRIATPIKLDGILDESAWQSAKNATDFIQNTPNVGKPASQKTEVKVLYDNDALYIGAVLYDVSKDSITKTLSNRDDFGNADLFGVIIDTYSNATTAFAFIVTAAGVQIDDLWSGDDPDRSWNAVWTSKVKVLDDKWIVEIKIPYSAIRFPNTPIQKWNINFNRGIRRKRESNFWNHFDPQGAGLITQLGTLNGVKDIKAPVRLSFSPYVSTYTEHYNKKNHTRFNGGMDLKYGINDAFTIDMTLIPDFSQTKFDKQVLNLSPFEIKFNENRQFFTEGTDLFKKNNLFYSRRIGSRPVNKNNFIINENEIINSNPNTTPLLNATKLTGRTKKGLGIGVFNGITRPTYASISDTLNNKDRVAETSPFTNYNVFVLDQNLKNNSSLTFTNASTWRSGNTYDANVTAISTSLFNKSNAYKLDVNAKLSQKYANQTTLGTSAGIAFHKVSGQFKWGTHYALTDDKFDPNDLGFLRRNNNQAFTIHSSYHTYKPFWMFIRTTTEISYNYNRLFNPNVYTEGVLKGEFKTTFKNFLSAGLWLAYNQTKYDYFEARINDRYFIIPQLFNIGFYSSSNYAKRFALDVSGNLNKYDSNRHDYRLRISPRFRISDKMNTVLAVSMNQSIHEKGLALTNKGVYKSLNNNPLFGQRNRQNIENSIKINYIFTNRMGLSFALRHYWAKVEYDEFYELNTVGLLTKANYSGIYSDGTSIHNNNFNAFTIDMAYRWVFAPGSELSLVWKNSIFTQDSNINYSYFQNTNQLVNSLATNSLSFKLLYYIDYNEIRSNFK